MPQVYKFYTREIHMIGDFVAVCWNTKRTENKILREGTVYTAMVPERIGAPYIDFVMIDTLKEEAYVSEDSPVDGGISAETALKIAVELKEAAEYLMALTN